MRGQLHVVVRARKDASAVESALERYYPDWEWVVDTVRGERDFSWIVGTCRGIFEESNALWKVLLLGRRTYPDRARSRAMLVDDWAIVNVGKAEVRNARLVEIVDAIELGRAVPRLSVAFRGVPELRSGRPVVEDQDADLFLRWGRFAESVREVTGVELEPGAYLSVRQPGNPPEEVLYDGSGRPVLRLVTPDEGEPEAGRLGEGEPFDLDEFVRVNEGVLRERFEESLEFLREHVEGFSEVVVPVSGGKDSACCLALGREVADELGLDLVAVYVDTGFDLGREVVGELEDALGVEVERVDVSDAFRRGLRRKRPTPEDRWCTGVKVAGIRRVVSGLEDPVLVVGDRDAESRRRRLRPPVHENRMLEVPEVNPLKWWSGAEVLGTLFRLGLPVSGLYERGFYRLGCSVCPSLTSWERALLGGGTLRDD
ncbi:phosphoadenosine phosphosulfate reductase domain-containing protein [Methanopyrus sp.]